MQNKDGFISSCTLAKRLKDERKSAIAYDKNRVVMNDNIDAINCFGYDAKTLSAN